MTAPGYGSAGSAGPAGSADGDTSSVDREPRFAGSIAWVPADAAEREESSAAPTPPPSPWSSEAQGPEPIGLPVVHYDPTGEPEDPEPRMHVVPTWSPPLLAIGGGVLAGIGSLLTWADLRLTSQNAADSLNSDSSSDISYNGLSLLEGRVLLVVGIAALVLGLVSLAGRIRPAIAALSICLTGGLGLIAVVFAAIGHPAELSTLFRSYRQIDTVKVSLPNGVGVWLAMGGAALILISGLLAWMNESGVRE